MHLTFFEELVVQIEKTWANVTSKDISRLLFLFTLILCMILGLDNGMLFSSDAYAYFYMTELISEKQQLFSTDPIPFFLELNGLYYSPYPLGYSLLGVPFYLAFEFSSGSPILGLRFTNMIIFSFSVYFTNEFANDLKNKALGLLSSLVFIFGTFAIEHVLHIWSHIPSMFFVLLAIRYLILYERQGNEKYLYISSLSSGAAFWIRYFNIILAILILLYLIIKYSRQIGVYLSFTGIFLSIISPTLLYHQISFGNAFITPYAYHALPYDIRFLRYTIWYMLIEYHPYPKAFTPAAYFHSSLLESSPILILSLYGFYLLYRQNKEFVLIVGAHFWIIVLIYGIFEAWDGGWCLSMRHLTDTLPFLSIATGRYIQHQMRKLQNYKLIAISMIMGVFLIKFLFWILMATKFYQTIVITKRVAVNQISRFIGLSIASFMSVLLFVHIKKKERIEQILIISLLALVLLAVAWAFFLNVGLNTVMWTSGGNRVLPTVDWIVALLKLPGYDDSYTHPVTHYPLYLSLFLTTLAFFVLNIIYLTRIKPLIKQ